MAKDFFGNLGQALSKTAKELSGRAEDVYETQRLKKYPQKNVRLIKLWQILEKSCTSVTKKKCR